MNQAIKRILNKVFSKQEQRLRSISKQPRYKAFKTNIGGLELEAADPPSFIAQYKECIQRNVYKFKANTKSPYIIDCGTNIGLSIISYKRMYPDAKIIGFEPDPKILSIANKNIKNANYTNIEIINKAVWTKETTLMFHQEGSAGGRLVDKQDDKTIKVLTFDLKQLLIKNIDFLKIDIEGAEYEIIKDIDTSLSFVKNIFIEYHSQYNQEQNLGEILNILKKNGFRYFLESGYESPKQPLISRTTIDNFDNLINIFGYRL
ncbi:MAG: FkbM family methyltransferase [Polaribacter sp.]|uniref:FkbM family methyltransferase n=1 Tax=Polaribacter sp. TaxID=1920175 RepID=UPI003BB1AF47